MNQTTPEHHTLEEAIEHPVDAVEGAMPPGTVEAEPARNTGFVRPIINDYGEPVELLVKVPIEDNGEPLVDIFKICPELSWAGTNPRRDFPRCGLGRQSVAEQLAHAQSYLPDGLRLQIIGVFRSFAVQKEMYERARRELAEKHPDWDEELLTEYINVFSAPPITETPPPHTTGGAVDLSIIDAQGERLDMTSPFELGWDSAPMNVEGLSETARRNRDLLADVLTRAGLTNFPGEWWHWSYGEPGWALRAGHPVALYDAIPDDQIPDWQPPADVSQPL